MNTAPKTTVLGFHTVFVAPAWPIAVRTCTFAAGLSARCGAYTTPGSSALVCRRRSRRVYRWCDQVPVWLWLVGASRHAKRSVLGDAVHTRIATIWGLRCRPTSRSSLDRPSYDEAASPRRHARCVGRRSRGSRSGGSPCARRRQCQRRHAGSVAVGARVASHGSQVRCCHVDGVNTPRDWCRVLYRSTSGCDGPWRASDMWAARVSVMSCTQ